MNHDAFEVRFAPRNVTNGGYASAVRPIRSRVPCAGSRVVELVIGDRCGVGERVAWLAASGTLDLADGDGRNEEHDRERPQDDDDTGRQPSPDAVDPCHPTADE